MTRYRWPWPESHAGNLPAPTHRNVSAAQLIGFLRMEIALRFRPGEDISRTTTILNELLWRLDEGARNANKQLHYSHRYSGKTEPSRVPGRAYAQCPQCGTTNSDASSAITSSTWSGPNCKWGAGIVVKKRAPPKRRSKAAKVLAGPLYRQRVVPGKRGRVGLRSARGLIKTVVW